MLQRSGSMRSHLSEEIKTLINSVPKELNGIAVQLEDAIHMWCSLEDSEIRQNEEEDEWEWKNQGETVVKLVKE